MLLGYMALTNSFTEEAYAYAASLPKSELSRRIRALFGLGCPSMGQTNILNFYRKVLQEIYNGA